MPTRTTDPIFVVGYMHSGTTMLLNILSKHPDVFTPRTETKFFMHMGMVRKLVGPLHTEADVRRAVAFCRYVVRRRFPIGVEGDPWQAEDDDGDLGLRPPLEHAEVLRRVLDVEAAQAGKTRWVEKTPTHVFNAAEIMAAIPDARFIEIVRDCRDILASKKTRREEVWTERHPVAVRQRRHLEKSYDPLWDTLSWRSAIRAGAQGIERWPDQWLRVRYEDFVLEPGRLTQQICDFARLSFSPELLEISRGIPADMSRIEEEGPGVSRSSVGRWQTTLTPADAALCEKIARRDLQSLGYPDGLSKVAPPILLARLAARSLPELAVRVSRRFRLGGIRYAQDVLKGYAQRLRTLARSRDNRS